MSGSIAMANYNITGVNQLEINDPGEGIVFKQGSSGDMVLKILDDSSDNILQYAGTNAVFDVAGTITTDGLTSAGNVTITGGNSDGSGNAFVVNRGGNSQQQALRVENSGEVVVSNNYLYAAQTGTSFYSQGDVVVRGNLRNDSNSGADPLKVSDKLNVTGDIQSNGTVILTSSGRNLTNVGTIGSTYITSSSTDVEITRPIQVYQEGGGASTAGGIFLRPHYSGDTSLSSFSSAYSSGDLLIGAGMAYKSGASGIVSTFANFSDERSGIRVKRGEIIFTGTTGAVQTAVGSTMDCSRYTYS